MNIIEVDFQSVIVGYVAGVALMWSLCEKLYGESDYGKETDSKNTDDGLYSRNDYMYNSTPK